MKEKIHNIAPNKIHLNASSLTFTRKDKKKDKKALQLSAFRSSIFEMRRYEMILKMIYSKNKSNFQLNSLFKYYAKHTRQDIDETSQRISRTPLRRKK